MKLEITKTRVKYLSQIIKPNELYRRLVIQGEEISIQYIIYLLDKSGRVPNGVTEKVRIVFQEAEEMAKEIEAENKHLAEIAKREAELMVKEGGK